MKAKKILVMAAMAIGFVGCSSEDGLVQSNYPQDNVVRINTNVESMKTRASYENSTDNLQAFGFCINNDNSTTYTYDNIKVEKDGSNWSPASQMLWQNANTPVDILAYAPFQVTTDKVYGNSNYAFAVEENQSADSYQSDLIVCKKTNFTPGTDLNSNKAVGVTFTHALSQLNLTMELRDEFNQDANNPVKAESVTDVKINGTIIGCKVDFSANPISVTVDNDQAATAITPETVSFKEAAATTDHAIFGYSAIVVPQSLAENVLNIEFKVNGVAYSWTSTSKVAFEAGKSYQLKLFVGKEVAQVGSITANSWTEGTTADLETE